MFPNNEDASFPITNSFSEFHLKILFNTFAKIVSKIVVHLLLALTNSKSTMQTPDQHVKSAQS